MSIKKRFPKRTVCEVLREIDDLVFDAEIENYQEIRTKLAEAEHMNKRMARKLYEYNRKWDVGWWEDNPDYEQDVLKSLERRALKKRSRAKDK